MALHFFSTDVRNVCPLAQDPNARGTTDARRVDCVICRAAIRAFDRGADETVKDAVAVRRGETSTLRMPAVVR